MTLEALALRNKYVESLRRAAFYGGSDPQATENLAVKISCLVCLHSDISFATKR